VRLFADSGLSFFVSSSFSKSFSIYGERVSALSIVSESKDESARVLSQVKRVIRTNYSNPPTSRCKHCRGRSQQPGPACQVGSRLAEMRRASAACAVRWLNCSRKSAGHDFSFVARQRGMFSYSGLTEQVGRLRTEFGIYALDTGGSALQPEPAQHRRRDRRHCEGHLKFLERSQPKALTSF
jgi:aromatic-amino-acid transaminase